MSHHAMAQSVLATSPAQECASSSAPYPDDLSDDDREANDGAPISAQRAWLAREELKAAAGADVDLVEPMKSPGRRERLMADRARLSSDSLGR